MILPYTASVRQYHQGSTVFAVFYVSTSQTGMHGFRGTDRYQADR